jgi:DNA polymerase-3 subunit epsilon
MKLELHRPICFFDLETTGTQIARDRIVEIAILKIFPNGDEESRTWKVNPEMPIPAVTTAIHGISNDDVKDSPTFKELAPKVMEMIKDCDLAGYNSMRFDIPLLAEEFLRVDVDIDMSKFRSVDVQNIFHKLEQRTLVAAYKFYCGKDLTNAHSADADTRATYEVLLGQLERYDELENDIKFLSDFSKRKNAPADLAGFLVFNDKGQEMFGFGKYKGRLIEEVLDENPGYFAWLQDADFPRYTKQTITRIKLRKFGK